MDTEVVDIKVKMEDLSDDEYEFEFSLDDNEYDEVLKELKARDSDLDDTKDPDLECPYPECNKTFSRSYNLTRHMQSHDFGNPTTGQICHVCGKTIKGSYSLHLKIHDKVKQFSCAECGREFRQKVALANHMLIHKNEKPFECQWCFKRFRQKYTLKDHIKRHTGVKDFICDLCGKEFTDKVTLQKHSLVHSTNKPHQCSTCFMSFRHKSSLSRHSKIHNKTTQCHLCQRSFRYESFLKKHLLSSHQDQDAINNPTMNTFTKTYREKYTEDHADTKDEIIEEFVEEEEEELEEVDDEEQQEEIEEDPQSQEECVMIAYDEHNEPQIIQQIHVDDPLNHQYQQYSHPSTSSATVIVNHHHSYT